MAMNMKALTLALLVLAFAAVTAVGRKWDGRCGVDRKCPGNLCCNSHRFCGLGFDYCGEGCQSGPCFGSKLRAVAGNAQCGDGRECPFDMCCSSFGRCGMGRAYCGLGCQSGPCSDDEDLSDQMLPAQ